MTRRNAIVSAVGGLLACVGLRKLAQESGVVPELVAFAGNGGKIPETPLETPLVSSMPTLVYSPPAVTEFLPITCGTGLLNYEVGEIELGSMMSIGQDGRLLVNSGNGIEWVIQDNTQAIESHRAETVG